MEEFNSITLNMLMEEPQIMEEVDSVLFVDQPVPEISVEEVEEHNQLIDFIRNSSLKQNEKKLVKDSNKSVMTFQTYMSTVGGDPDDLENLLLPSDLDLILINFEKCKGTMDLSNFKHIVAHVLRRKDRSQVIIVQKISRKAETLFGKIDWLDNGVITWEDFCAFFLYRFKDDKVDQVPPFEQKERVIKLSSLRDSIAKLIVDCNSPSKYILITKDGEINNVSSDLTIQRNIHTSKHEGGGIKQIIKTWITDMIALPDINKLVVATDNRDLQFYDMATPMYSELFHLIGLPTAALCLFQYFHKIVPHNMLYLFFGTDLGEIHMLTFHCPNKKLFETPFQKSQSSWKIFFSDLSNHFRYVTHKVLPQIHSDWVIQIAYVPESNMLLSCCNSGKSSLLLRSVDEKKEEVYKFNVTKGIQCFDYNKNLGLLATGSVDHILRLWDPYVTTRPMAILKSHQTSVIGLFINENLNLVFSYSKDGHLCSFDIKDHLCIQSIHLKFPLPGKIIEHATFPMLFSSPTVMIVADTCLAELKLMLTSKKGSVSTKDTHNSTVVKAICVQSLNEVITACESGEIHIWNLKTGQLIKSIIDTTITEELSAMAIDCTSTWLACGYVNGTGAVWNIASGLKDKTLERYDPQEITSIIVLADKSIIFMFGWCRKILAYHDTPVSAILKPDKQWLDVTCHEDDILCATFIPPIYFATSSFDGDIFIWNIENRRLAKKIQIGRNQFKWRSKIFENLRNKSPVRSGVRSSRSRHSARRVASSLVLKNPVDCLFYLGERESVSLVSTEGNTVKFWSTVAIGTPQACFNSSESFETIITSLASNTSNTLLITGDSEGCITIWNIEGYATFKRFSQVISQVMNKKQTSANNIQATNKTPPPLLVSWVAHENEVVTSLETFVNLTMCGEETYLISSSSDCCVIIWTMKGVMIGIFSQTSKWNLESKIKMKASKNKSKKQLNEKHQQNKPAKNVQIDGNGGVESFKGNSEQTMMSLPPVITVQSVSPVEDKLSRDIEKIKNCDNYKMRNEINERIKEMKGNWSKLGCNYNSDFRRRMFNRSDRRRRLCSDAFSKPLNERGGLNNICSPFNALILRDTEDIALPKGLPITPRMLSKSINPYNSSSLDNLNLIGS